MIPLYELNITYFYFMDKGDNVGWILFTNKPGTKGDKNKTILI